jgi:hypothetical protein
VTPVVVILLKLTSQINHIGVSPFLVHSRQPAAVPKNNDKKIKENNSISVNQTNKHHLWLITWFVIRLTPRVPLVKQDLLTLTEHLSSPVVLNGVRVTLSLVLCVCFVNRCLSFCAFSFGHCVICPSSIYRFWLPLWYLQTLLMLWKSHTREKRNKQYFLRLDIWYYSI